MVGSSDSEASVGPTCAPASASTQSSCLPCGKALSSSRKACVWSPGTEVSEAVAELRAEAEAAGVNELFRDDFLKTEPFGRSQPGLGWPWDLTTSR
jgi:hypothetical protein